MENTDPIKESNATEPFDVFLWANEIDEVKNNVSAELFLFNKNYTPYKIKYSDKLTGAVKSMFMQEAVHYIIEEADKGLEVRDYEKTHRHPDRRRRLPRFECCDPRCSTRCI